MCLFGLLPKDTRDRYLAWDTLWEPSVEVPPTSKAAADIAEFEEILAESPINRIPNHAVSATLIPVTQQKLATHVVAASYQANNQGLVTIDRRGNISLFDNRGKFKQRFRASPPLSVSQAQMSNNGATVIVASGLQASYFKTLTKNSRFKRTPIGYGRHSKLDPSGQVLLSTLRSRVIHAHQLTGRKQHLRYSPASDHVTATAISDVSQDNAFIVAGNQYGQVTVWPFGSSRHQTQRVSYGKAIQWLHINHERILTTVFEDNEVLFHDLANDKIIRKFSLGPRPITALLVDDSKQRLMVGYRRHNVDIRDLRTGKPLAELQKSMGAKSIQLSQDGQQLSLVNFASHLSTWDLSTVP